MKKLITIILIFVIPFITIAQSNKNKKRKGDKKELLTKYDNNFMIIRGMSVIQEGGIDEAMTAMTDRGPDGLLNEKMLINFDFGSNMTRENKELMEKSLGLRTMTDAVNLLYINGWEFMNSDIVNSNNIMYHYYYMKRRK
tara:strand:+ start:3815 stop:4234 length:420 start_codon:yes stop_codon:yes gene_type:complete